MTRAPLSRPPRSRLLQAATGLLLVTAAACSGTGGDGAAPPSGLPAAGPGTTTTTAAGPVAQCTPEALAPPVRGARPDAAVTEIACEPPFAVATVAGAGAARVVALLRFTREGWTLVTLGAYNAADPPAVPDGFSTSALARWRTLVNPAPPPTTPPAGGGGTGSAGDPGAAGGGEPGAGEVQCTTSDVVYLCEAPPVDEPPPTEPPAPTEPPVPEPAPAG